MINPTYEIQKKYNKTIALLADIHFSKNYSNTILSKIVENLKINKPDYICISGDIIDDADVLDNQKLWFQLKEWLIKFATISPVIISYGNHDEVYIREHKSYYVDSLNYFSQLNKIKNIYFLNNENIKFQNINFIGYHPTSLYFANKENYDLNEDLNKIKPKIKDNHYNILLCHSPIHILKYNLPVNLILSGHMHDGLVLPFFKNMKGNYGFIGPYKTLFPKYSRGIIKNNETFLIITGGIKKISNSSSVILRPLNLLYQPEITYIKI